MTWPSSSSSSFLGITKMLFLGLQFGVVSLLLVYVHIFWIYFSTKTEQVF